MKTRKEIYSNEATELLRVISEYKALLIEQVLYLFPGQEMMVQNLIYNLRRQGRIWVSEDGKYVKASENVPLNDGLIKAIWVLLDFFDFAEYHCAGCFPISLCFFLHAEYYEVIFIPNGQGGIIQAILTEQQKNSAKRIVIVSDMDQVDSLNISGVSGFCTVSDKGAIQYYQKETMQNE